MGLGVFFGVIKAESKLLAGHWCLCPKPSLLSLHCLFFLGAADVISLGDAWIGGAIRNGLVAPIPSGETYRYEAGV